MAAEVLTWKRFCEEKFGYCKIWECLDPEYKRFPNLDINMAIVSMDKRKVGDNYRCPLLCITAFNKDKQRHIQTAHGLLTDNCNVGPRCPHCWELIDALNAVIQHIPIEFPMGCKCRPSLIIVIPWAFPASSTGKY